MNNTVLQTTSAITGSCLMIGCLLLTGCGKNEATGSVMGTSTGAIIGAAVGGKNNGATGAVIGGLLGNAFGSSIGRAADDQEAQEEQERRERLHARRMAQTNNELEDTRAENNRLRAASQKWCSGCNRQSTLLNASSCSSCGDRLIQERLCNACLRTFSPSTGYRYCPYCPTKVVLVGR
jgi:ribosomal protein L32